MSDWHPVCPEAALAEGSPRVVRAAGRAVAVFRDGGHVRAIDDVCPHMGASLARGRVADGCVSCPMHFWRFRLADGAWADNPVHRVETFETRVEAGTVSVRIPESPP